MPVAPVPGPISHEFGEDRRTRTHNGVDYAVDKGTPVKASASGRVVAATFLNPKEDKIVENGKEKKKFTGAYGNVIVIYHGRNIETSTHTYTLYAHLDERSVSVVYSRGELATFSRGAYAGPIDISESFESIPGPLTIEYSNSMRGAGIYFEITVPVPPGPTQPFNFHQFGRL